jgi:hypothetical protein
MLLGHEKIEAAAKEWSKWAAGYWVAVIKQRGLWKARRILLAEVGKTIGLTIAIWLSLPALALIGAPTEMLEGTAWVAIVATIVGALYCLRMLLGWIELSG